MEVVMDAVGRSWWQLLRGHYGDAADTAADGGVVVPMATSHVTESEETLDDGTLVKRRVVTTTQHQLTTDTVRLEHDDDDELMGCGGGRDDDDVDGQPVFDYTGRCLSLLLPLL